MTITSDRSGNDDKNTPITDLPKAANLLPEVFRTDTGAETLPVSLGNDGYVWFDVREIIPERERPLAEVREKATADWIADQQRTALAAKAEELKARLDQGETLATIAGELGLTVETKTGLHRQDSDAIFGPETVKVAFSGPEGVNVAALGADGESRLLMHVSSVAHTPAEGQDAGDQQIQQVAKAAGDDMLDQMVSQLQKSYGVSINQALADQAMAR